MSYESTVAYVRQIAAQGGDGMYLAEEVLPYLILDELIQARVSPRFVDTGMVDTQGHGLYRIEEVHE